jgi:hypothetical protein
MRVLLILVLCLCWTTLSAAADRLLIDAKVNDQAVRLAFDTGTEYTVLFGQTARRLNLKVTEPPPNPKLKPWQVPSGVSEECRFTVGQSTKRFRFRIFNPPEYTRFKVDGVVAWADLRNDILRIVADTKELSVLKKLPENICQWARWNIEQDSRLLEVKLPGTSEIDGTIFIDTGIPYGVQLSAKRWKYWRAKLRDRPYTLVAYYTPGIGLKVYEQRWADKLVLRQFSVMKVPVMPSSSVRELQFTNYEATLGLFALTRLDVIIDGKNSSIYTRQIQKPTSRYEYNRIGAVFVPRDIKSNHLVAHVAEKSPAQKAGIRNGDILMKIGDLDVTKWRTDPKVLPLHRFWIRPAGTKLELSLMRDDKPLKASVELKDIFP